jgi:hypothetical protein
VISSPTTSGVFGAWILEGVGITEWLQMPMVWSHYAFQVPSADSAGRTAEPTFQDALRSRSPEWHQWVSHRVIQWIGFFRENLNRKNHRFSHEDHGDFRVFTGKCSPTNQSIESLMWVIESVSFQTFGVSRHRILRDCILRCLSDGNLLPAMERWSILIKGVKGTLKKYGFSKNLYKRF